ncbi:hypothetical protein BRD01_09900 [Halobacteriales archaeon QS_8_65_32]|nr:MAG: hypothetical protein BRD01_09900 [Halobacteriales archaeon QS_8_65_32]
MARFCTAVRVRFAPLRCRRSAVAVGPLVVPRFDLVSRHRYRSTACDRRSTPRTDGDRASIGTVGMVGTIGTVIETIAPRERGLK